MDQDISSSEYPGTEDRCSLIVDRDSSPGSWAPQGAIGRSEPAKRRTSSKQGLTGPEIMRYDGCLHFMALSCQPRLSRLWFMTVNKCAGRQLISAAQKRITRLQKKQGLPAYNVTVLETLGGLHAHITFIGDRQGEIAKTLKRSEQFGDLVHVQHVYDTKGLSRGYLAKEQVRLAFDETRCSAAVFRDHIASTAVATELGLASISSAMPSRRATLSRGSKPTLAVLRFEKTIGHVN